MLKILKTFLLSSFFIYFAFSQLQPGFERPTIYAQAERRSEVLGKIARYVWARRTFDKIKARVEPYADRHQVDPEWILSKWGMHWKAGKHRTYASKIANTDDYLNMSSLSGNAPVPTVRIQEGNADFNERDFRRPTIEEMEPYPGRSVRFPSIVGGPAHYTAYGRNNWCYYHWPLFELTREAGMLYWLTREEKYAKLAADNFMQWLRGASYMNRPIGVSHNFAFFSKACSADVNPTMFYAYDFVHDYLMENNDEYYYDRRYIDPETGVYPATGNDHPGRDTRYIDPETGEESIELMADAFAYKFGKIFVDYGLVGNNHEMVDTSWITSCALAISDRNRNNRLDLLSYLFTRDGRNQRRISKQLTHFNERGLNKEPLGYHNYPVSQYMETIYMLENANYNIMGNPTYSKLFKATYIVTDYIFAHGFSTAFGNNGTVGVSSIGNSGELGGVVDFLEMGYKYAKKYNSPEKYRIAYELNKLINKGYLRGRGGRGLDSRALLANEGVVEKPSINIQKNRSDEIDFAGHTLQRNGDNELESLMYTVVGGGNFSHAVDNGLTVEWYGKGFILSPDSGVDNYQSRKYKQYTSRVGSHNAVVIDKQAVGKWRQPAHLVSIDPPIQSTIGVSDNNSFSLNSYDYRVYSGFKQQRRNIMMNRTAKNSGYYLDVFWSHGNNTDYLHHHLSSGVPNATFRQNGAVINGRSVNNELRASSPGYHFFSRRKKYNMADDDFQADLKVDLDKFDKNVYMRAWVMGDGNRTYYHAHTQTTRSVQSDFQRNTNGVMVIRDTSPNFNNKPFIVLYEPYRGDGRNVIDHVRRMNGTKGQSHYVGIVVSNSDRNGQDRPDIQYLISSKDNNAVFNHERVQFKGYSATVSHNSGELSSLYLGKGSYLANYGYRLEKARNEDITAYLKVEGQKITFNSQNDTHVTLSYRNNIERAYTNLGLYYKLKGSSEIRSATEQTIVPNDRVTTVGYGTITGVVPNTQTREVLLLPLEKRDYIGANTSSTVKVYHNGRVSKRRVLFDNDSEISFLINSPTGLYSDTLIIKKDRQIFSEDDYDIETIGFGEARVHLRNIADLDSGLHKVSFIVPGDGYIRKEYNVSLLRSTSSTRLVKVFPNPYKYGEHRDLKIEYFIPRNADRSEYILLIANVKGDEMDSVSMSAMSGNTGMAYWDTFRVKENYDSGLYMIALMDKNKRKIYDRKYILVEK